MTTHGYPYTFGLGDVVHTLGWETKSCTRVAPKATNEFMLLDLAVLLLDPDISWNIEWYRLADTPHGVVAFSPSVAPVHKVDDPQAKHGPFWPPGRGGGDRKRFRLPTGSRGSGSGGDGGADPDNDELLADQALAIDGDDADDDEGPSDLDQLLNRLREGLKAAHDNDSDDIGGGVPVDGDVMPDPPGEDPLPPVPPPPAPDDDAGHIRRAGPRGNADVTVWVEGGRISFYSSKKSFEAVCGNPLHKTDSRCVRTCGVTSSALCGGRPLGLLAAWLANNAQANKAEHWAADQFSPTFAERQIRRTMLALAEGTEELFAKERPLDDGEQDEPLDCV